MKSFLAQYIDGRGRAMRAVLALLCFGVAWFLRANVPWLALVLLLSGVFTLFEALRGWCAFRACGIKTPL